jgi:hypothetical protein
MCKPAVLKIGTYEYELEVVYFFNMVADHPFGTLAILDKIEFELFVIVQREVKISLHSGK